ncbi:MAG TPA: hypothetical protein VIB08_10460 [Thermoanaerobaculia bacterium]
MTRGVLFLLLAPAFMAEVLTQNMALTTFLQPVPFVLCALTYGVPVLVIREIAAARGLGVNGVVVLGLAYGIFNEGVIAKTLSQPSGPEVFDFSGYGQIGAMQIGLAIFIVFWHALHSVLYPILIGRWLFPEVADSRWLASGRARHLRPLFAVILIALYSLYFVNPVRNDPGTFLVYVAVSAGLVTLAVTVPFFRARPEPPRAGRVSRWPALLGATTIVFYVLQIQAPRHVPFAVYLVASVAVIAAAGVAMGRAGWRPVPQILQFGLGDALTFALFATLMGVKWKGDPAQSIGTGALFAVLFLLLLHAVRRAPQGRAPRAVASRV